MNRLPEHKTAYEILDLTRGRDMLWHRISLEGFYNILMCGEIHANLNNRYKPTYPQSNTCLARKLKAISLFDFDSESVEKIIEQEGNWVHFLKDFNPITIVMGFKKAILPQHSLKFQSSLDRNEQIEVDVDGMEYYPTRIPAVEAYCITPINTKSISEIIAVKYGSGFIFKKIPFNDDTLTSLERLKDIWAREINKELESESANPFSILNLLSLEDRSKN